MTEWNNIAVNCRKSLDILIKDVDRFFRVISFYSSRATGYTFRPLLLATVNATNRLRLLTLDLVDKSWSRSREARVASRPSLGAEIRCWGVRIFSWFPLHLRIFSLTNPNRFSWSSTRFAKYTFLIVPLGVYQTMHPIWRVYEISRNNALLAISASSRTDNFGWIISLVAVRGARH